MTGKAPSPRANGSSTRRLVSWIDTYLEHTKGAPTPKIFRLWTAIATIGAALERRCYVRVADQQTYANLFVLLVGRPGIGKTAAISPARNLLKKTKLFHVAPNDVNRATFLKWMAGDECRDRIPNDDGGMDEYHSVTMQISEFGIFVKAHDLDLLSALCELYDCPPEFENRRMYQGKDTLSIPHPQVSILAGTQPGYMASVFPPEAWSQGFMSRMIMVHSGEPVRPSLFEDKKEKKTSPHESALLHDLCAIKQMQGQYDFTDEAKIAIEGWYNNGTCDGEGRFPVPTFPRLENYNTRRIVHLLKLCQISAAARTNRLTISLQDFELALDWLLEAEKTMPSVFMEMAGRSDVEVLRDMWAYAWTQWSANKKEMHRTRLMAFLSVRVPAWSADKIIEMSVSAGYFKRDKDTNMFQPRPKNEWGHV